MIHLLHPRCLEQKEKWENWPSHPIHWELYCSCFIRSRPCTACPGRSVLLRCICLCNRMLNSRNLVTVGIWMEVSLFFGWWWSLISSGIFGTFYCCFSKASEWNTGWKGLHPAVRGCLSKRHCLKLTLLWLCPIFCSIPLSEALCSWEHGILSKKQNLL